MFLNRLDHHYQRIKNESDELLSMPGSKTSNECLKLRRFSFNCDVQKADKCFEAEVQKSDSRIPEALKKEMSEITSEWLQEAAGRDFINSMLRLLECETSPDEMVAHREDFDLKANSVSKWTNDGFTC